MASRNYKSQLRFNDQKKQKKTKNQKKIELQSKTDQIITLIRENGTNNNVLPIINRCSNANQTDEFGLTALHWAVIKGNLHFVEALIRKEADPNCKSTVTHAITPLHCLFLPNILKDAAKLSTPYAYYSQIDIRKSGNCVDNMSRIVNLLMKAGARILPDAYGMTPLSMASYTNSMDVGQYLLSNLAHVSFHQLFHYFSIILPKLSSSKFSTKLQLQYRWSSLLRLRVKHGILPSSELKHIFSEPVLYSPSTLNDVGLCIKEPLKLSLCQLNSFIDSSNNTDPNTRVLIHRILFPGVLNLITNANTDFFEREKMINETNVSDCIHFIIAFAYYLHSLESLEIVNTISCLNYLINALRSPLVFRNLDKLESNYDLFICKHFMPNLDEIVQVHDTKKTKLMLNFFLYLRMLTDYQQSRIDITFQTNIKYYFSILNDKHLILECLCSDFLPANIEILSPLGYTYGQIFEFIVENTHNLNKRLNKYIEGTVLHVLAYANNRYYIEILLRAEVYPLTINLHGQTFLDILKLTNYDLSQTLCKEYKLTKPYKLIVLSAFVYTRYHLPLHPLHRYPLLLQFVIMHCTKSQCKQMCNHCCKKYFN